MDWQSLKTMAQSFIHRKDIDFALYQPLAVDDIDQALTVQENESAQTLALTASTITGWQSAALPADYARARSALDSTGRELTATDINGLVGRAGAERYYAVSGGKLYAASASVTLIYSAKAPLLVADGDRNWLSDKYSTVLLYGLLKHLSHMIQDFDARDQHQAAFDYAVAIANSNYSMQTLAAGAESRTPYAVVSN